MDEIDSINNRQYAQNEMLKKLIAWKIAAISLLFFQKAGLYFKDSCRY